MLVYLVSSLASGCTRLLQADRMLLMITCYKKQREREELDSRRQAAFLDTPQSSKGSAFTRLREYVRVHAL
jgi:hypothetical protein